MAIVTRRYRRVGTTTADLVNFVAASAALSTVRTNVQFVDIDDAVTDNTTELDAFMTTLGFAFEAVVGASGIVDHETGVQSYGVGTGAVVGVAKGVGASDLQTDRTLAGQVALGANSFTAGRRNVASGAQSTSIGDTNTTTLAGAFSACGGQTNTGTRAVALGNGNTVSGFAAFVMGTGCVVSGSEAVGFGDTCTAGAARSFASGRRASASRQGQWTRANERFSINGDSQHSDISFLRLTTDATVTELTLDGLAPAAATRFVLTDNTAYVCRVVVVGRNTGAVEAAMYEFEFGMDRAVGVATVRFVGAVLKTVLGEDVAAWDANVAVDVVNGSLMINVTGVAATTIRWSAAMYFTEVRTA